MIEARQCIDCKQWIYEIVCKLTASNSETYGWWCPTCEKWIPPKAGQTGGLWVKKQDLIDAGMDLSEIPIVSFDCMERCMKCGKRGAELHHWAPRAMFGDDADCWPKDYLCKTCHDTWHKKVTPQLCR